MDNIIMNSEKSKICKPHILILKLTDKLDLRRGEKSIALSNLSIFTHGKTKNSYNNNKFNELPDDLTLYQIFKTFWVYF